MHRMPALVSHVSIYTATFKNKEQELKNWKACVTFSHPTVNGMNISEKLEITFLKF